MNIAKRKHFLRAQSMKLKEGGNHQSLISINDQLVISLTNRVQIIKDIFKGLSKCAKQMFKYVQH